MAATGSLIPMHSHSNKDTLDQFSETSGHQLLFRGKAIDAKVSEEDKNLVEIKADGIYVDGTVLGKFSEHDGLLFYDDVVISQEYPKQVVLSAINDMWKVFDNSIPFPYANLPYKVLADEGCTAEVAGRMIFTLPDEQNKMAVIAFIAKTNFEGYSKLNIELEDCSGPVCVGICSAIPQDLDTFNNDDVRLLNASMGTEEPYKLEISIAYTQVQTSAYLWIGVSTQGKWSHPTTDKIIKISKIWLT